MKKREQHSTLQHLPHPASPKELDERILAHAREQAPAPPTGWRSGWTTGLATAAVVGLAVLITDPLQQAPDLRSPAVIAEYRAEPAPEPAMEAAAAALPAGEDKAVTIPTREIAEQAVSPQQRRDMDTVAVRATTADDEPARLEQEADVKARPLPKPLPRAVARSAPAAPVSAAAGNRFMDSATAGKKSPALTAKTEAPKASLEEVMTVAQKQKKDGSRTQPTAAEIDAELAVCTALLQKGDDAAALEHYESLKARCGDCELPETLAQALEKRENAAIADRAAETAAQPAADAAIKHPGDAPTAD